MNRRSFLRAGLVLAPAVILTPGLLMPVRELAYVPYWEYVAVPLDAQFALATFWMKAPDRATRDRVMRDAARLTLYPNSGLEFIASAPRGTVFGQVRIGSALGFHAGRIMELV